MLDGMSDSIQRSRIEKLHSREVDHQSPTGLILYLSIHYMVLLFIRAPFYVLLVFIAMCAVFWLFWLSYQYLPSDWLERLVCAPILLCFLGQLSHLPYHFWH